MQELPNNAVDLQSEIVAAIYKLDITGLENQLAELTKKTADPSLWQDQVNAQKLMKEQAALETRIRPWRDLEKDASELSEMLALKDPSLEKELETRLKQLSAVYYRLKQQLLFSGQFDDHVAIVSIHAGAGGTDAQDWTGMLHRMYVRYGEKEGANVTQIDQSAGEEAGLKSTTFEIALPFAYGKLKGEHGVHRLVRLSPFNADNLRQTSFAKVEVMPKIERPEEVEVDEKDLKIDVYRAGWPWWPKCKYY